MPRRSALIARLADGGMRDAESLLDQVLAYAGDRLTAEGVSARRWASPTTPRSATLVDAYLAGDAPTALDRIEALADAGRDMAQVAAQAEGETRRRLLRSAADPVAARRLAAILRTLAEAAGAGAREGRSRLMLELLAVEPLPAAPHRVPDDQTCPRTRSLDSARPTGCRRGAGAEPGARCPTRAEPGARRAGG